MLGVKARIPQELLFTCSDVIRWAQSRKIQSLHIRMMSTDA